MLNQINKYIDSKKYAWAPSTLKTEKSKLTSLSQVIDLKSPPRNLWEYLMSVYAPYTRKTLWQRIIDYHRFLGSEKPYVEFQKVNARLFKHVYKRKELTLTWDTAHEKILKMSKQENIDLALKLLYSGMRFSESFTEDSQGIITGKGGKLRKVFYPSFLRDKEYPFTYSYFYQSLKREVGISPHQLRKLAITRASQRGASAEDLCKIAGWSGIETAFYYLQPKKDEQLKELMV